MTPETLSATHARAFAGQGRGWSAAEFAALLDSPYTFVVGDARAFALGRAIADEAELLTLATDPGHRRAGLGRACLARFEAEAKARGAVRGFLEVAADNAAACALYAAARWRKCACRAGYYPRAGGIAVDALILEKHLG
ncbi:ribosomal-protein-alanine acetyltransferase [Roseovarius sp. A46]|uniref:GNAT family N-acetyltransferase n=1 Tax=Roseovarius sp. A46 TaxID=2109331 RepID=UPI001012FAE5|nr:GNAT family N-acetyltransferase [Roseovarius sp. A46]RXV60817.1 ribosomal-protein-alanine acetyltransferase [Roseovarius sp. A46]